MRIIIPSLNRAERVFVKDYVPDPWHKDLVIAVQMDQVEEYEKHNPDVQVLGCPIEQNLGGKRQWLLEYFDDQYIAFVDDDAKMFRRVDIENSPKLENIKDMPDEQYAMWCAVEDALDAGYGWSAISYRMGTNNVFEPYKDNQKATGVFAFNKALLRKHNIRFDYTRVMDDVHVPLSLMALGYPTRVWFQWSFNQLSNAKGGCSVWRTPGVQKRAARKLHRKFPDFTRLVEKQPKSDCWFGTGQTIVDLRVQWKKAYEFGLANNSR